MYQLAGICWVQQPGGIMKWVNLLDHSPDILHMNQGVTPCWKSVHWISGYQGYHPAVKGIINGYQEEISQSSNKCLSFQQNIQKYLLDIPKYCISQISVNSGQRVKT